MVHVQNLLPQMKDLFESGDKWGSKSLQPLGFKYLLLNMGAFEHG